MNASDQAPVLEAIGISKSYGKRRALDNLSLAVRAGEVAALLGPNGAGKTTTLSILSTLLRPDSGRVLICGNPPTSDRAALGRLIGLVPQSLALYPSLSAAQNVWHFARMQGLASADAAIACARALEEVGLADRAHDRVYALSGGLKRRLNLACGIVHLPSALLLDEPTVGVDLESRERILELVRHAARNGAAVIYSTHYMEEAERVCDRALLIDQGKLVADGTVDEVISLGGGHQRMEVTYRGTLPDSALETMEGAREISVRSSAGRATLELASLAQVTGVLDRLRASGVQIVDFSLHSPNLSDAFIALTGRTLRDSEPDSDEAPT